MAIDSGDDCILLDGYIVNSGVMLCEYVGTNFENSGG
jgi:hypothetical protein